MSRNDLSPLHVVVSHAEPLLAAGIVATLLQEPGFCVATQGEEALLDESQDRIVITDYENGLRFAAAARQGRSRTRVLVTTALDRERDVRVALETGVHGYLLSDCSIDELCRSIRSLGSGSRYLCPEVAQRLADSLTREPMTARETQVLELLATGLCNKNIARHLDVAVGTVKTHVNAILTKLDASNRTEAASIASLRGLVTSSPGACAARAQIAAIEQLEE
jgi:DNA-binding NarL/FixJ family response regulator